MAEFRENKSNALTELSELRMELSENGELLDVLCQIKFATAEVEFSNRSYCVGIRQARLQLYLDGWETSLGSDLGSKPIAAIETSKQQVSETALSGKAEAGIDSTGSAHGGLSGSASRTTKLIDSQCITSTNGPIVSLPNNAWKIEATALANERPKPLEGTVLQGERLCSIKKQGRSNRSRVTAELQVRKSKVCVEPSSGNKLGKRFSILRNRDAIIGKVLERALAREAEQATTRSLDASVVASRVELEEL